MKKILTSTEHAIERTMVAAFGRAESFEEALTNFRETYPHLSAVLLGAAFLTYLTTLWLCLH